MVLSEALPARPKFSLPAWSQNRYARKAVGIATAIHNIFAYIR